MCYPVAPFLAGRESRELHIRRLRVKYREVFWEGTKGRWMKWNFWGMNGEGGELAGDGFEVKGWFFIGVSLHINRFFFLDKKVTKNQAGSKVKFFLLGISRRRTGSRKGCSGTILMARFIIRD